MQARLLAMWAFYWEDFTAKYKTSLRSQGNPWKSDVCKDNLKIGALTSQGLKHVKHWSWVDTPRKRQDDRTCEAHVIGVHSHGRQDCSTRTRNNINELSQPIAENTSQEIVVSSQFCAPNLCWNNSHGVP